MLDSHNVEPPSSGNWGWVGTVLASFLIAIQAWYHKRRTPRVPAVNAKELFDRMELLEFNTETSLKRAERIWGDLERNTEDIRGRMVTREDLDQMEARIKRALRPDSAGD